MNGSKVTIADVARESGVSITTVSRVVNGSSPYLSVETRRKVEEAIERLHYTPNQLIRSLQCGRTNVIAYSSLYPGVFKHDQWEMGMIAEICRAARPLGYDVLVPAGSLQSDGVPKPASLMGGRCDGVLLSSPRRSPVLDYLASRQFPTVVIGSSQVPLGVGSVQDDNVGGVRKAVEHLLMLGHTRIAHLVGPVKEWDAAGIRMEEYVRCLEGAGIPPDPRLVLPSNGSATWDADECEVESALRVWLELPEPPTAVFCASDRLAIALVRAAGRHGIDIPADLSVVGFDDLPMAREIMPPLTTVSVPLDELATAATEMLRDFIVADRRGGTNVRGRAADCRGVSKRTVLAELVIRSSTARPRAKRDTVGSRPT